MNSFWNQSKEARQARRLALMEKVHTIEEKYGSVMNCPKESDEYETLLKYSRNGWMGEDDPYDKRMLDELEIDQIEAMAIKKMGEGYPVERVAIMLNISMNWAGEIAKENRDKIRSPFAFVAEKDDHKIYAQNEELLEDFFGKNLASDVYLTGSGKYPWMPVDYSLKSGIFYWWEMKPGDVYVTKKATGIK